MQVLPHHQSAGARVNREVPVNAIDVRQVDLWSLMSHQRRIERFENVVSLVDNENIYWPYFRLALIDESYDIACVSQVDLKGGSRASPSSNGFHNGVARLVLHRMI